MPSNFTPNYQLNQWNADDRVLRTDFNADNAKIDAALGKKAEQSALAALQTKVSGKAEQSALTSLQNTVSQVSARAGSEILGSTTLTKEARSVRFDLSGVDWSNFSVLIAYIRPANGIDYYTAFEGRQTRGISATVLFPLRSASTQILGFHIYHTSDFPDILLTKTFAELKECYFNTISDETFAAGTTARVIGIH